ncbi:integrin beta-8 isoform X1 [Gadus macrocephalus]|uniref:integrin beta-8 isoform X1 n=1 Tax=Gadus macrocephalus TaxID=80720 RepID=UPI0028CB4F77|nr:integrin beta-8 isoform X1 [Gadus macrocephalus]
MTSWLRTHSDLPWYALFLCLSVEAAVIEASSSGDGTLCRSSSITSCTECLRRGPQCAWCFQEAFLEGTGASQRCDLPLSLLRKGCSLEAMEHPEVKVEVNATLSGTQVSPSDIQVTLRPGSEASFIVAVSQLQRYPVDLYYLVDVSASMKENLDQLKTVGVALSHRMREHSSDLHLGFGSFVDKPVSPYINVHPSKINNPCSDYEVRCRPAHGYHHILSVTHNITEFSRVIERQLISGNMDTPEGGLDAMLQAAVCQRELGWRTGSKRLLLLMTDQPSHLALDSRLAGIVRPNDGLCHLENNVYTESTTMDHPSLNQLSDKLLENHIYSIFAVEKQQYQWYKALVSLLPGSYLGRLGHFQAPNLIELVVDAYKRLLSEVGLEVLVEEGAGSRYWLSVSPLCPEGSTANAHSCSGVLPNQTVYFNITIGMRSCPDENEGTDVKVTVRPVGYNESTVVRVQAHCRCRCGLPGRCRNPGQSQCRADSTPTNGEAPRKPVQAYSRDSEQNPGERRTPCRAEGAELECGGRGVCECGSCVCEQSKLGAVYGAHCEMDDFSCPYKDSLLCGGRGMCVSAECVCDLGWTGESCGCPVTPETCQTSDGAVCSGRGRCQCGRCVCDAPQNSGTFCEKCPICHGTCQSYWKCVDCHLAHGLLHGEAGHCNQTCAPLVGYVDYISGDLWSQCVYIRPSDSCHVRFHATSRAGLTQLYISTRPECAGSSSHVRTFMWVCALTVFCGLVVVTLSMLLLQRQGRPPGGPTVDLNYHPTSKDLSFIPTTNEKTVTYRRDHPPDRTGEMSIQVHKITFRDPWQC